MKRFLSMAGVGFALCVGCANEKPKLESHRASESPDSSKDAGSPESPGSLLQRADTDAGRPPADAGGLSEELAELVWLCQNRSIDDCAGSDHVCVAWEAQRYDAEQKCFGDDEPALCTPNLALTTGGVVVCLEAPDGTTWRAGAGVPVIGWTQAPKDGRCESRRPCG